MRIAPSGYDLLAVARTVLRESIAPHVPAAGQAAVSDVEAAIALGADKLERGTPPEGDDIERLESARAALRTTLLQQLPRERQYDARLVAKVLLIARNQLVDGNAAERDELDRARNLSGEAPSAAGTAPDVHRELESLYARMSADIRAGRTDPGSPRHAATYDHLCATTRQAVRESNPSYLRRGAEAAAVAASTEG